eukprot:2224456-Rhodomonas_salina.1
MGSLVLWQLGHFGFSLSLVLFGDNVLPRSCLHSLVHSPLAAPSACLCGANAGAREQCELAGEM